MLNMKHPTVDLGLVCSDFDAAYHFYHDLLGMEVVTVDGDSIGEVTEVYELRPADLLEVMGPEKSILIPYISQVVHSVSVDENRIVLDPPDGLLDV